MFIGKRKRKPLITDFVAQYCNKRDECSSKTCPLLSAAGAGIAKADVAYTEVYDCPKYRSVEEGGAAGTEIIEMGVWK